MKWLIVLLLLLTACVDKEISIDEKDDPWWLNRDLEITLVRVDPGSLKNCGESGNVWQGCFWMQHQNDMNICRIEIVNTAKGDFFTKVYKHEVIHCMGVRHGDRMDRMMLEELIVSPVLKFPAYSFI
jgi:hypothetical protein